MKAFANKNAMNEFGEFILNEPAYQQPVKPNKSVGNVITWWQIEDKPGSSILDVLHAVRYWRLSEKDWQAKCCNNPVYVWQVRGLAGWWLSRDGDEPGIYEASDRSKQRQSCWCVAHIMYMHVVKIELLEISLSPLSRDVSCRVSDLSYVSTHTCMSRLVFVSDCHVSYHYVLLSLSSHACSAVNCTSKILNLWLFATFIQTWCTQCSNWIVTCLLKVSDCWQWLQCLGSSRMSMSVLWQCLSLRGFPSVSVSSWSNLACLVLFQVMTPMSR